ncbi:hypothetical protein B484DRAFT_459705 [Ochromonadaceae sp. CCMP2298]|nr:hypothetical protein B484DRAFT_459705 [Ochromonadaceae sp. CCMP2298]
MLLTLRLGQRLVRKRAFGMALAAPRSHLGTMLKNRIPSNYDALDKLNQQHRWIPNQNQTRPAPQVLERKEKSLNEIYASWATIRDYILYRVWGRDFDVVNDKFVVFDNSVEGLKAFKPNDYPYETEVGNHWVMWYGGAQCPYGDDRINEDIDEALTKICEDVPFDFAWYENPAMTVPEFYHVQVFWVRKAKPPLPAGI